MRAAFVIPGMVLAMALAGCAGRGAAGPGTGPGQAAGAPASPAPDLSTTHAAPPTPAVTGYQGVVVTDSLQMAGVLQGHTPAQVAVQAVAAGCDQLLMPGDPGVAYHALLGAVQHGRINPSRQRNLARQLANRSITVVANDRETASGMRHEDRYLPLRSKRVYVAGPAAAGLTAALQPELAATGGRIVASPAQAGVIVAAGRGQ